MARITAELTSGTAVQLTNGRHQWRADEPLELRGTDTGPNPYGLLLGSTGRWSPPPLPMANGRLSRPATAGSVTGGDGPARQDRRLGVPR